MKSKNNIQHKIKQAKDCLWLSWLVFYCLAITSPANIYAQNKQDHSVDPTVMLDKAINTIDNKTTTKKSITFAKPKPVRIENKTIYTSAMDFMANDTEDKTKNNIENKLLSARITPVDTQNDKKSSELKDLIDRLNSIQLEKSSSIHVANQSKKSTRTTNRGDFSINAESIDNTSISSGTIDNDFQKQLEYESFTINNNSNFKNAFKNGQQKSAYNDTIIQRINYIIENKVSFDSNFELGEIMFNSQMLSEASVLYKRALETVGKDDEENRPWILYQIANSLRDTNHSEAIEYYRMLIAEFPGSEWAQFAKTQLETLTWYINDDPKGLIRKSKILVE